jgi:two-component system, chemotaxis family, response regulator Rcp1
VRPSPIKLLYVEDDSSDVDIAQRTIKDIGCESFQMETVEDGEQALQYLNREETFQSAHRPDLIFLDLNLPKIHGRDVLKAIKENKSLRKIPVVILSTSKNQNDIDETYQLGAAGYFVKPNDFEDYRTTFTLLCNYWGQKVALPSS